MMSDCRLCPRMCGADRASGITGYCGRTSELTLARAAFHHWEEPCISGTKGSGAVFFSGCTLGCIYCQNRTIALGKSGKAVSIQRLADIFLELASQGAHNINLVTPTHYIPQIINAIELAKARGLTLPFVYNTSGYERVESLAMLDGLIDIYLPDFKYWTSAQARRYSLASDYSEAAKNAIAEMVRQCPKCTYDAHGIMQKGVIVRHMLMPKGVYEAKCIMQYLYSTYGNDIVYSLMSQYTPMQHFEQYSELNRKVKQSEYDRFVDYCIELGIENAYIQDGEAASESFVPPFDNTGI